MKLDIIKSGIKAVGNAVKAGAKKIAKAIAAANTETLIKFGIVFGVGIVTSVLIIKFLKDKKKSYHSEENKTVVDEAININYNDVDNQEKLHPLMKKVKKNLNKDLKPRKAINKKTLKAKKAFEKASEKAKQHQQEETEEEFIERSNREFDAFMKRMAFEQDYAEEINKLYSQEDNYNLRAVWEYN